MRFLLMVDETKRLGLISPFAALLLSDDQLEESWADTGNPTTTWTPATSSAETWTNKTL